MKNVKLRMTESTVVQGRCQQHPGCTCLGQYGQVASMAHTACRIQSTGWIQPLQLRQTCNIGSGIHAYARQSHDDHLNRPALGVFQHGRRTQKVVSKEIQRQQAICRQYTVLGKRRQALAAQNGTSQARILPSLCGSRIGKTAVHPEFNVRVASMQLSHDLSVIAPPKDGIQISNVNSTERVQRKQSIHHRIGTTGIAQHRFQWLVFIALSGNGAHNLPVDQIEYRDNL